MIKKIFYKLFPPYEVKLMIGLTKDFMDKNKSIGTVGVERYVVNLFKTNPIDTIKSIRKYKKTPEVLMLSAISIAIEHHLLYENCYSYRGVLNFFGEEIVKLDKIVSYKMLDLKEASKDEILEHFEYINDIIKSRG